MRTVVQHHAEHILIYQRKGIPQVQELEGWKTFKHGPKSLVGYAIEPNEFKADES